MKTFKHINRIKLEYNNDKKYEFVIIFINLDNLNIYNLSGFE